MTTKVSFPRPLEFVAGVRPTTEGTALSTLHFTASDKIRFFNGLPQKLGGWESVAFSDSNAVSGLARTIYSASIAGTTTTLIGTHTRLYALYGSTLTNITPLSTSSTAAANSLATLYTTLANNPITTVLDSQTITIADTSASRFVAGDTVTLSGAAATNGVPAGDINAAQVIRSIGVNSFTIRVATAATSSGTGGGASVVRACGMIQLTKTSHGLSNGDRVKISGAATTGGVTDTLINKEHIIRNVAANTYDVLTTGTSTSSASASGGAGTVYYPQIASGNQNESYGQGYGMGKYGVGLYGTALTSTSARSMVRIWFVDRFASTFIINAGGQTGVYEWDGSTVAAPVLVTNAPTTVNYAFVSDNILITFGNTNENRIKTSEQGDRTNWTSSSTNQVYIDDIEDSGRFISHVHVNGVNLIFTDQRCYTFRKISRDSGIWEIRLKDPAIGLIAPMARVVVNGIALWMGENNFYMWRGSNIEFVPANTQRQSTILKYVFENINRAQKSKFFAWHNEKFNEVWFHYCSSTSNEPDRVARVCLQDFSWCPDTMGRTAAEYPNVNLQYPKLINSSGTLYQHEKTMNDDGAALTWNLTTNDKTYGKDNAAMVAIIPDSVQVGSITATVEARSFPQSTTLTYDRDHTITATTERVPSAVSGRYWKFTFTGSAVDQSWTMGQWQEELQTGAGY